VTIALLVPFLSGFVRAYSVFRQNFPDMEENKLHLVRSGGDSRLPEQFEQTLVFIIFFDCVRVDERLAAHRRQHAIQSERPVFI
jgi:hypothetical protein